MSTPREVRRRQLWHELVTRGEPVTGGDLAERLGVSRQVIVQDVALLRARYNIIATPRGYWAQTAEGRARVRRAVAVKHPPDLDVIARELNAIVDEGARVVDVIVEHAVYGEFRGILMLQSRRDVQAFLARMAETDSEPLSSLTGGVHLHTLEADREEDLDRVERVLDEMGLTARSWDEDGEGDDVDDEDGERR